jgi:hypothetical protein
VISSQATKVQTQLTLVRTQESSDQMSNELDCRRLVRLDDMFYEFI